MRRVFCCWLILMLMPLVLSLPTTARADGDTPLLLAKSRGPIIWQVEEEKQKAMDNDLELLRLYNEAMAAKKLRKNIALGLFIPGATLTAVGFAGGLFQKTMSLYDEETGEILLVGGVSIGLSLTAVAIYFGGAESRVEKEYKKYIQEKYGVAPIVQFLPTDGGVMARVGVRF